MSPNIVLLLLVYSIFRDFLSISSSQVFWWVGAAEFQCL
jgi:hypothetical protein